MENKIVSFHGDPRLKKQWIDSMKAHAAADELVQGQYWENGKGCWIGCSVHKYVGINDSHDAPEEIERIYGIPQIITRLIEDIFENLDNADAKDFSINVIESMPVGVDLLQVWPSYVVWILEDPEHGVLKHTIPDSEPYKSIISVIEIYRNGWPPQDAARAAAYAARAAARAAAYAADAAYAAAYAADAADAAADAAYAAARAADAAYAAADAAADAAVRKAHADKLIELFKSI